MDFKNISQVLILILFSVTFNVYSAAQVNFESLHAHNTLTQLATNQVPYFIYFSGVWCPSCQLMEETTFQDKKLGDQIQKNYKAYKVDVDSKEGKELMAKYAVTCLPTTIFYDETGALLERVEKPIISTELIAMTAGAVFQTTDMLASTLGTRKYKNPTDRRANDNSPATDQTAKISLGSPVENNGINRNDRYSQNKDFSNRKSRMPNIGDNPYNHSENLTSINPRISDTNNNSNAQNDPTADRPETVSYSTELSNGRSKNASGFSDQNVKGETYPSSNSGYTSSNNGRFTESRPNNLPSKTTQAAYRQNNHFTTENSLIGNDYQALLLELDVQIKELKTLSNLAQLTETNQPSDQHFTSPRSGAVNNTTKVTSATFLAPTTYNLATQIAACKSLLTNSNSLEKLIGILEEYQTLL
ncbi:MAG: thioredoxin family protein, partial [Bacteroidota bacterium]